MTHSKILGVDCALCGRGVQIHVLFVAGRVSYSQCASAVEAIEVTSTDAAPGGWLQRLQLVPGYPTMREVEQESAQVSVARQAQLP